MDLNRDKGATCVLETNYIFLQSDAAATIFFAVHFIAATNQGQSLFRWEASG